MIFDDFEVNFNMKNFFNPVKTTGLFSGSIEGVEASSTHPPLRYSGSKRALASQIMREYRADFPNEQHLLSPFLGAGAVELRWMHVRRGSCHAADADGALVNFWEHLLHDAKHLAEIARGLPPITHELFYQWKAERRAGNYTTVEHAAQFFVMTYAKIIHALDYWPETAERDWNSRRRQGFCARLSHFKAPRLTVAHQDYREFLSSNDGVLYIDSPYWSENQRMERIYDDGIVPCFSKEDHEWLADALSKRTGWIASNHNCEWVRERYRDYRQVEIDIRYESANLRNDDGPGKEILIICPP